jgi:hypothetical protein
MNDLTGLSGGTDRRLFFSFITLTPHIIQNGSHGGILESRYPKFCFIHAMPIPHSGACDVYLTL